MEEIIKNIDKANSAIRELEKQIAEIRQNKADWIRALKAHMACAQEILNAENK